MADLQLDFGELNSLKSTVDTVSSTFARAERVSEDVAGYTGHDGLAGKVREFADNWDIGRGKLQANLDYVSEAIKSIVDTFTDLDQGLADAAGQLAPTLPVSEAPTAGTDPAPTGSVPSPSGPDSGSDPGSDGGTGGPGGGGGPGGSDSGVPGGGSEGPGAGVPGSDFTPTDPAPDGMGLSPFPRPEFELVTDPARDSDTPDGQPVGPLPRPEFELISDPSIDSYPDRQPDVGTPGGEPPVYEANPPKVDLPGGFPDTGGSTEGAQPVTETPGGVLPGDTSSAPGETAGGADSGSGGSGGSGSGGGGSSAASFPEGVPSDPSAEGPLSDSLAAADSGAATATADGATSDGDIRPVVADRLSGEPASVPVDAAERTDTSGVPVEAAVIAGGAGLAAAGIAAAGVAGAAGLRTRITPADTTTGDER